MPETPTAAMEAALIECNHGQTNRVCRNCIAVAMVAYADEQVRLSNEYRVRFLEQDRDQLRAERDAALARAEAAEAKCVHANDARAMVEQWHDAAAARAEAAEERVRVLVSAIEELRVTIYNEGINHAQGELDHLFMLAKAAAPPQEEHSTEINVIPNVD